MTYDHLKILLVDDDEVDRIAVKRALNKTPLKVDLTEADASKSAIANLVEQSFAVILLDYRLPDCNGLELISQIKQLKIDTPFIVLTGQGDEEIAVEIMKAGASDYLAKSKIEPTNLAKSIKNAIRLYQAEKAVAVANRQLRLTNELLLQKNKELEQQQQQIQLKNLELQEAYNLKSQFLATMSHELRTPMNAIMGFSQLLLRQYPDPLTKTQQDIVERIFNNSQNLLNMINEMLDFSKIEAGKLELSFQEFDLVQLVTLTVEELRSLAIQQKIDLKTHIDLSNQIVYQDKNSIKRILINLISNAIKFTEHGEVQVTIIEIDSDKLVIAVEDTGIGIAPENLKAIFQAFRQIDQTFTRKYSGTGLGLAITDSLVKMIRGTISVKSQLGKGSIFKVEIPRKANV
ncbi:response regulator receiver sensor signal transduction histidine kinase [Stanieria cyanosphaera PCC 7437]|uniref:Circadian input-output histidine kinase CikA n=1 Tax=Stanieria cyanosphaera (strain ATCC 29371 / PCC 7437) TaxID=111780 RepID=K9XV40_STAC7|nr:hybrid sensor histidine kinase/response regulator [Stanieria cyanosphaera]AFZ36465.1 response regulator receiver sensor signal transduction histidine kinase [Stanieria cyanosphaera PCC 7437]